jgi:hypothetical protein
MSGWRTVGSSSGRGMNSIGDADPVSSLIRRAMSITGISCGLPMFIGPASDDSRKPSSPSTRSLT